MMHIWNRAEQTIVGILGLVALAFALWQVLSRYILPQGSISYAEEVIVYLVIWAIMIVSSQLVRTDSHVRPDLVLNVVPGWLLRWMEMFNCTAAIVFCGALVWYGWQIVATARLIDERSASGSAVSDVDLLCGAADRQRADADPLRRQADRTNAGLGNGCRPPSPSRRPRPARNRLNRR